MARFFTRTKGLARQSLALIHKEQQLPIKEKFGEGANQHRNTGEH